VLASRETISNSLFEHYPNNFSNEKQTWLINQKL